MNYLESILKKTGADKFTFESGDNIPPVFTFYRNGFQPIEVKTSPDVPVRKVTRDILKGWKPTNEDQAAKTEQG